MKNIFKRFVISVFVPLIGLSFTACDGPFGGGANFYQVVFNFNDGAPTTNVARVRYRNTVTALLPTKTDHNFAGWYTDNTTFNNRWDFSTPVTENIYLYARWLYGLTGTWQASGVGWTMDVIITATTYSDAMMDYVGDIVNIRLTSTDAGYITIRFTEVSSSTNHYDVGRYYVISFKNFVSSTSIDISGAFLANDADFVSGQRIGGKATLQEAEAAYTTASGAFAWHDSFTRQS